LAFVDPSAGVAAQAASNASPTHFTDYAPAYQEAQRTKKPLLVILNPGEKTEKTTAVSATTAAGSSTASESATVVAVKIDDVRKTQQRRELLDQKYVVVVIDASTKQGEVTHRLFNNRPLPHVSVIDRDQKLQAFRTSRKLQGDDWNKILETFQTGDSSVSLNLEAPVCPSCQFYSQQAAYSQP
jgi:hypothetical protein